MSQEDHDVVMAWAVDHARQAYARGERPSRIIRALAPVFLERLHYYNSVLFVIVFHTAFGLSLIECKDASEWWHPWRDDPVDDAIDDYLMPLIDRSGGIDGEGRT